MKRLSAYLTALLTEKGFYNDTTDEIKGLEDSFYGEVMGLTVQDVIDFCTSMDFNTQRTIQTTFTKIDFHNGDCFDFWNHIVRGFGQAHGYDYTYQPNPITGKVGTPQAA